MRIDGILPGISNKASCLDCGEPIVKGEGVTKVTGFKGRNKKKVWGERSGYYCLKCSEKLFNRQIESYQQRIHTLGQTNKLTEQELNEKKIGRML